MALVSATLVGAMLAHVYLATNLVSEDRLATIFDLNSMLAGTLSEQLRARVTGLTDKLMYFAAEHGLNRRAESSARAFFATDEDLLSLSLYERTERGYARVFHHTDKDRLLSLNLVPELLEEARRLHPIPLDELEAIPVLLQNASSAPDVALVRLSAASADRRLVATADLRPDWLLRVFGSPGLHQAYVVDRRGKVIVHPDPASMLEHADLSDTPLVRQALEANVTRGAREYTTDEGALLGAFARLDLSGLAVVVEIPKAEAFKASRELTRRSTLLAGIVIGVALLASLYFSRRLARPLRTLEGTMARVSRGEFGVEVPVTSHNEIGAVAAAFNQMSRELSAREAQLAAKNAQLIQSEKLSAIGELSAGLAHEVKNPMVGIVGFSQLGREATSLDEAKEYFALVESDAQRANAILQNLLEFARPEVLELDPLEVNLVVEGALRLIGHQLQLWGVQVSTRLAEELPRIAGSLNPLQQVLVNLLMNAGQAMEHSAVKRLTIATSLDPTIGVVIEIRDTGPGMSAEVQRHLFEPFFTTKPRGRGTGLGLSVSRTIVLQHRGRIRVESVPGQGSAFFVELPALNSVPSVPTSVSAA